MIKRICNFAIITGLLFVSALSMAGKESDNVVELDLDNAVSYFVSTYTLSGKGMYSVSLIKKTGVSIDKNTGETHAKLTFYSSPSRKDHIDGYVHYLAECGAGSLTHPGQPKTVQYDGKDAFIIITKKQLSKLLSDSSLFVPGTEVQVK